jgi:phage repressor protein C with HTH and peptisase S24 domain
MANELDKKAVARRLVALRDEHGVSQAAVAQTAGCNQRSVAEIEKGGSFSVRLLRDVATALGVTERWLQTGTGPKDAPHASKIGKGNIHFERTAPLREVPVVSWAAAGAAKDYHDLADFLEERISTDCKDPNAFCVIVDGDSMEPDIHAGDRVVVSPNTEAQSGDLVIVRTRKDHDVYFKKFLRYGANAEKVRLVSLNASYPPLEFKLSDFRFIYPVVNMVRIYRRSS